MWNDVRFALRTLRRSPGFTIVAVLSLALGIGANTAIFSLLYQVAMRTLPVRDPASLVQLETDPYNFGWTRRDNNASVFSYPMYRTLRDGNPVFSGLVARSGFQATLAYRDDAVRVTAEIVTGNFFETLGVAPGMGRLIAPADDAPGQTPVIVLGYSWWSEKLGADPRVVNDRVLLNGRPVTVAGVAPRGFRGIVSGRDPEFYVPVSMIGTVVPGWERNTKPDSYWLSVFGRLRPGVQATQADAALLPLYRAALESQLPLMYNVSADARKKILAKTISVRPATQGLNVLRDEWQTPLVVLAVMVALVLAIACANVANLLIARATARARETAVRLAIGASAWQLTRQLMVEGLLLSAAGGLAGLFLSQMLTAGLLRLLPPDTYGGWVAPQANIPMLLASLALTAITGLLFSIAPALQAARTNPAPALKAQSTGNSAAGSHSRSRQALVVAQICLSLLLLVGAGLFTRTLVNLMRSDPGFQAEHLITFSIDPAMSGYGREARFAMFRGIEEQLRAIPGAKTVARAQLAPFSGWGWGNGIQAPGTKHAAKAYLECSENSLGPGYFATLGIPLVAGREFTARDTLASPKVAVLNHSFARFLFEGENPIGRHIRIGSNDADAEIVGIVKDSRYNDVKEKPPRFLYVPFEQGGDEFTRQSSFFVRVQGSESTVLAAARRIVKQIDANLPIERLTTMDARISESIYTERTMAILAVAFGVLATALAAVGLYGVVAYSVTRRTREFGIRLVLGAVPRSLLRMLVREILWLVAIGAAVGLPASYALARLAESQLYGVRAHDAPILAGAAAFIAAVAIAAGIAPAVRAMRIEPMRALRHE
jgi:predicted permease